MIILQCIVQKKHKKTINTSCIPYLSPIVADIFNYPEAICRIPSRNACMAHVRFHKLLTNS